MVWTRSGSTRAATPSDDVLRHGESMSHSVSLMDSTDSTRRVRSQRVLLLLLLRAHIGSYTMQKVIPLRGHLLHGGRAYIRPGAVVHQA